MNAPDNIVLPRAACRRPSCSPSRLLVRIIFVFVILEQVVVIERE
jgi:hypothetical protein